MSVREELAAYIRNAENDGDKLRYLYESTCGDHGSFRSQWLAIVQAIADAHRPAAEPELPKVGDVWGKADNPKSWRHVGTVGNACLFYGMFGDDGYCFEAARDSWDAWVRESGAVNITAKLREGNDAG